MRVVSIRPSGQDADVPVFNITLGEKELEMLLSLTGRLEKELPKGMFELSPVRARAANIRRTSARALTWLKTTQDWRKHVGEELDI